VLRECTVINKNENVAIKVLCAAFRFIQTVPCLYAMSIRSAGHQEVDLVRSQTQLYHEILLLLLLLQYLTSSLILLLLESTADLR